MAPRKIKVKVEAAGEHEIEVPEEFLHKDDINEKYAPKDTFQAELERRVESITKERKKPEDLIVDDVFVKSLIDKRKDDVIKMLGLPKPGEGPDLTKVATEAEARVREAEVKPLAEQVKAGAEEISGLRGRDLDAQVHEAANTVGVVPDLVDLVKMYVRDRVGWDPKLKQWFVKKVDGSEGFEFSTDPKAGGAPYKKVRELLQDMARDPARKAWFADRTQAGADFRGNGDVRGMTVDIFNKLKPADKTKFMTEHPEEAARIMGEIQTAGESRLFAPR